LKFRKTKAGKETVKFGKLFQVIQDIINSANTKTSINFNNLGNLLFKFDDASNIELFCFGSQVLPSSHLQWLLSGKLGALLEGNIDMPA
jgi:hypothetical protein